MRVDNGEMRENFKEGLLAIGEGKLKINLKENRDHINSQ